VTFKPVPGDFRFDHADNTAVAKLSPEHVADFMRLAKNLRYGSRFQLLVLEYNSPSYRTTLIEHMEAVLNTASLQTARLELSSKYGDFSSVENELQFLAAKNQIIHIFGGEDWFDEPRWRAFNLRREAIAHTAAARLLLWLGTTQIKEMALSAPDLWAWRGGVFSFILGTNAPHAAPEQQKIAARQDASSLFLRRKRIAELQTYLQSDPAPEDDLRWPLLDEVADLHASLGELDEALRIRQEEELPIHIRLGNVRAVAATQGEIANILFARDNLDEALRLLREEVLPAFTRLGDVRSVALIQGKIVDILLRRGELKEALRILREEVLPAFTRLGDVRSVAVTQGRIAEILSV
jgi:tetratricopeptide (TPR) repeat protein